MKKIIYYFIFIVILLTSLSGVAVFLFNAESALRGALTLATKTISGKLTVEKISGNLRDFTVVGVEYKNTLLVFTVKQAQFAWHPGSLLRGIFDVDHLNIDGVKIQTFEHANAVPKWSSKKVRGWLKRLSLLSYVHCRHLKMTDVIWQTGAKTPPLKIDDLIFQLPDDTHLNFALHASPTALLLQGEVGDQLNLIWKFSVPQLARVLSATGSIYSDGVISGTRTAPKISGVITADRFVMGDVSLGQFKSKIDLDLSKHDSECNFNLQKFKIGTVTIPIWQGKWLITVDDDIKFSLSTTPFAMHSFFDNQLRVLQVKHLGVDIIWRPEQLALDGNLIVERQNPLYFKMTFTRRHLTFWNLNYAAMAGKLAWQIDNLSFLDEFFPQLERTQGHAEINYNFAGTLRDSKIDGQIVVTNASLALPKLGISLHDVQFKLKQDQNGVIYNGGMRSGNGNLRLDGQATFGKTVLLTTDVSGENFLLSNTPEYSMVLTPQLHITFKNDELHIDGSVLIPQSKIKIDALTGDTTLPSEVVFVDQQTTANLLERLKLYGNIKLELGDAINIEAFNIKGLLRGTLIITDVPNRPTMANGTLTIVNGAYNMYGQTLEITQGELHFVASPIDNPELNMRAIRKLTVMNLPDTVGFGQKNDLIVGLQTAGALDNLQTELFSIPSGLSKTDIFSYLVLGQPAAQATENKMQLLLQAAHALNFSGAGEINHVVDNLRNQLGLSELSVTSEATSQVNASGTAKPPISNTALVLGKFLSSRLYVSYSIGFLDQINIFRARYSLGRYWSVQSENSALNNGVDLIYSVERN